MLLPHSSPASFSESPATRFHIRTADLSDAAQLADLLAASFHTREGWMRWVYPALRLGIYEDLRARLRQANGEQLCLVAVAPPHVLRSPADLRNPAYIVGTIEVGLRSLSSWQPWQERYPYISNLAVHADYRKRGIGQALLQTCDRIATNWGYQHLYLHVMEDNHLARRLYGRTGYYLHRAETSLTSLILHQPQRLLMCKVISR